MTLIDKIVHYICLLLFGHFFKLVYLSWEVEKKSDTILHNIHPGAFDPYGQGRFRPTIFVDNVRKLYFNA